MVRPLRVSFPVHSIMSPAVEMNGSTIVLAEYGWDNRNGRLRYRKQISEDLTAGVAIRDQIVGQSILGSAGFISWKQETFLEDKTDREGPDVGRIHKYLSKETVLAVVGKETGR